MGPVPPAIPSGTSGQTLVWRGLDSTSYNADVASGTPQNYTAVTGTGYLRKGGSRVGPNGSEAANWGGRSIRIPDRVTAGSPTTVFDGTYNISGLSAIQTRGMFGGWFKFVGNGGGTVATRVLTVFGGAASTTPVFSIKAGLTASGARTMKFQGDGLAGTTSANFGNLDQWIWLSCVWEVPQIVSPYAGTKTYRVYAMLLGDSAPTLICGSTSAIADIVTVPTLVRVRALYNESGVGTVDPWYGACDGCHLYSLSSLSAGALYPTDVVPPTRASYASWFVNTATGSDSNSGYGASQAWATVAKLQTEVNRGTVLGDWGGIVVNGTPTPSTAVTSLATGQAVADAYDAGNVVSYGDTISVAGGSNAITQQINLEQRYGVTMQAAGGSLSAMRSLGSSFTQPNAGTYPNVWQVLGSDFYGLYDTGAYGGVVGYAGTTLMQPQGGANLAAVISTLNSNVGRCYADASGFYFSSSTNPNSNGVSYTAGRIWQKAGTGTGAVAISTGMVKNLTIESCPVYAYTATTTVPQYCISGVTGNVGIIDACTVSRGSYHLIGMVGNGTTGLLYRRNVAYSAMPTLGGATTDVGYTSETATSNNICNIWRGCTETSVHAPGAAPVTVYSFDSLYWHSNGGRTNKCFVSEVTNCTWVGNMNASLHQTAGFVATNVNCRGTSNDGTSMAYYRCLFNDPRIQSYSGSMYLENCIILPGSALPAASGVNLVGSIVMDFCTIDLRGCTVNTTLWTGTTSGTLELDDCAVIMGSVVLTPGATTVLSTSTAWLAVSNPTVKTGVSYNTLVSGGQFVTCTNSTTVNLDSASYYAVQAGSPVIGAADDGGPLTDYLGVTVFNPRNDAGAREYST
jgi:hypothetical protein